MPVIYDEVFSGLWRLGVESTRELLGEDPDVACYAKLLTGGLVPMAATVATERVFDAFRGARVSLSISLRVTCLDVGACFILQSFIAFCCGFSECGVLQRVPVLGERT